MQRLIRFLRNPIRPMRRRAAYWLQQRRYAKGEGYDESAYWKDRLSKYGFDKRGVGIDARSPEENERMYAEAREIFLALCERDRVSFAGASVIEIGCGAGYYTGIVQEQGCARYTGVDITAALFGELGQRFPGFEFVQADVTADPLPGRAGVIVMIDVTQHIVDEDKFRAAMRNVDEHLDPGGVFIVTSWLTPEREKDLFYHVRRPMQAYRDAFPGWVIGEPVPFRDKFLFTLRKPGP